MSNSIDSGNAKPGNYHWWYDSKAAGVRNAPGAVGSPTGTPPADSNRRFSFTNMFGSSPTSSQPMPGAGARRDSMKLIHQLSDFGTPDT